LCVIAAGAFQKRAVITHHMLHCFMRFSIPNLVPKSSDDSFQMDFLAKPERDLRAREKRKFSWIVSTLKSSATSKNYFTSL
jgi:hypothetical protein